MRSSQIRILFVSLLAVFAVSAVASGSASAAHPYFICTNVGEATGEFKNHECKEKGTKAENVWKMVEVVGAEKPAVTGTSGTSKLAAPTIPITIECTADTFTGSLELRGLSTGEVKFTGCKVVGAEKCKVTEPIAFKFEDKTTIFKFEAGDLFEPTSGSLFVTIEITGAECLLKGKYEVEGKQQCELPEAGVALVKHKIVCLPSGSELRLKKATSEFTSTETVELSGADAGWAWEVKT